MRAFFRGCGRCASRARVDDNGQGDAGWKTAPRDSVARSAVGAARKRASVIVDVLGDSEYTAREHAPDFLAEAVLRQATEADAIQEEEMAEEEVENRPLLALVAHDSMKKLMATFAREYREQLSEFRLTGTGTTCKTLAAIGLTPEDHHVPSGPLGGDQVLGGMLAMGEIKALFFFRDPLSAHPHAADIEALTRIADVYQVYCCTNYRTAAAVVTKLHQDLVRAREARSGSKQPQDAPSPGRVKASVCIPEGMADLSAVVQSDYQATRAAAVAKALVSTAPPPGNPTLLSSP